MIFNHVRELSRDYGVQREREALIDDVSLADYILCRAVRLLYRRISYHHLLYLCLLYRRLSYRRRK